MILHGFFRSSASYRVRIALNLKGIAVEQRFYKLRRGDQRSAAYLALNPQGLVPSLVLDDGRVLTQSLAIIEWLDETHPEPALLSRDAFERARVRGFAQALACDTHPLQNLRVLQKVESLGHSEAEAQAWARAVNEEGLAACEQLVACEPGPFCFGAAPSLADICLIPQLANSRRFGADLNRFPRLLAVEAAANALHAFQAAAPALQPDAE